MIPYLIGFVGMILVSRSSDRRLERKYHAAIPAIVAGIAFLSLGVTRSAFFSIGLLSFVVVGLYSLLGPLWALPSEFLTGFSAASGIALITSVGILGGFVGPYAVGLIRQRTAACTAAWPLRGSPCWCQRHSYCFCQDEHADR
jgi:ACS family tartrate transporter-like MFS transporter